MMIKTVRPGQKHLTLLVALVAMLTVQPLVGHKNVVAGAFFDAVLSGICLYMFFIIFGERRQRQVALMLLLPAIAGYPHLTLPMGMVKGLPVGLSLIGPAWGDRPLLALGASIERLVGPIPGPRYIANSVQANAAP